MPTYEHLCEKCHHEWDEFYSIKSDPPNVCPSCGGKDCVKRLVSGGSGKGIMILSGRELRRKISSEAASYRRKAATDENLRANLVGEDVYHQQVLNKDSLEKELVRIGKDASSIKSTDVKTSTEKTSTTKKGSFQRIDTKK